jgi:hypothetical protein
MSVTLTRYHENERRYSPNRTAGILAGSCCHFSAGQADKDVRGTSIFTGESS